jgi:TrmH family RNA methyltransferase
MKHTDSPDPKLLAIIRIVLARTSHPGNIGAAARAMKTMGLSQLYLVNPAVFPSSQADAMASSAADLLKQAHVCSTLAEALAGTTLALGVSARRGDIVADVLTPPEAATRLLTEAQAGPVALVFGNETSGMSNEELGFCQGLVTIDANPEYSSLNLAAAVQVLSYEIRRIKRDMDWGANFSEALMRFEKRVSTPVIARTVTLITKASEMSGQISEVLSIASSDAKMSEALKRERLTEMFIYTAIVYLSFFVFLFVVAVLTMQFLPILASVNTEGLPATGSLSGFGTIAIATFARILYHACLIQALFSGLIAGQMGESSLAAGVKHSCVLLIIALVTFNVILV